MARNEQLIRQHKILQILERVRFGKTIKELSDDICDELGLTSIHQRTIKRDLDALQAAGIDVDCHETQRGKVWKLGPLAKKATRISFSASELIALSVGRQLMHPLAGTPFWSGIESFWKKIQEEIPDSVFTHYEKFRKTLRVLGVPAKSYEKQHGIIKTLNRGVLEHRIIEVKYASIGKPPKVRKIEPYTLVLFQSSLYVIAAACEDENPETRTRSFKLDRFESAKLLDAWFKIPSDLDIDAFVGSSLGMFVRSKTQRFKIRISAAAARWVSEDPWHPDQKIKKRADGQIELSVEAAHDLEIIPRVLSMGANAEIVSPASARKSMARIVEEISDMYS